MPSRSSMRLLTARKTFHKRKGLAQNSELTLFSCPYFYVPLLKTMFKGLVIDLMTKIGEPQTVTKSGAPLFLLD